VSEIDDLAAFAVLVEAGSFTLAAQQLGCSKGQLSKRISLLEERFSVLLLQRTTRRLSLTAAGAALLPQAQALLVAPEGRYFRAGAYDRSGFVGRNVL
jgi:DNA-binding transcriptional LysR family regulator